MAKKPQCSDHIAREWQQFEELTKHEILVDPFSGRELVMYLVKLAPAKDMIDAAYDKDKAERLLEVFSAVIDWHTSGDELHADCADGLTWYLFDPIYIGMYVPWADYPNPDDYDEALEQLDPLIVEKYIAAELGLIESLGLIERWDDSEGRLDYLPDPAYYIHPRYNEEISKAAPWKHPKP